MPLNRPFSKVIPFALLLPTLGGCARPTAPAASMSGGRGEAAEEAAEAARRDERRKIMQEYWYEHTAMADAGERTVPAPAPLLSYPAGFYQGINFGPREAPDPALAEPIR